MRSCHWEFLGHLTDISSDELQFLFTNRTEPCGVEVALKENILLHLYFKLFFGSKD